MHKRPASSILTSVVMTMVLLVFGCLFSQPAAAQSPRIVHEIVKDTKPRQSMGRDLWFAMAENYELQGGGGGKYYQLYVASPARTNVHIALGKTSDKKFPIQAEEVLVFDVPLAWELTESGTIENKAVHVWSEDADLTAYLLSRNPATSDGMYIIPSVGWGTEYIVAAFASYAYLPGYELPSEFVVIANQDNTTVTINPSTDLREGISTAVAYPRKKPFTIVLQKGQAVQYQASAANGNMEDYDVTGTIITSSKPVGVVGGVMCANVPAENPYCDHICDMIPPTRTWATTYYTAPYINRKGGDGMLVIAKEDNTTITRTSKSGTRTHCVLNKYQSYMRHDIDEASKWSSDKPFLLVQYCNSTDYPDPGSNNGIGDPNMTIVNSVEQFSPYVLFQTPKIRTAEIQFRNYVNVIVHKAAVTSTKFDGQNIGGKMNAIDLPGTEYTIFRGSDLKPGAHTIVSDSGVGVYIYGYGSYDSYAWTGAFGTRTFQSPDIIAPEASTPTDCFHATVKLKDVHVDASKLNAIDLDTIYNFTFDLDPDWQAGTGKDSAFYDINVVDQTKEAFMRVVVFDAAGNTTTITSRYTPQIASIEPPLTDFGKVVGSTPATKTVKITNLGKTDFNIASLKLQLGNKGFALVNPDRSPLPPGQSRDITVSFLSIVPETVGDTILFGDDCVLQKVVVIGNGGKPDYTVFGVDICPVVVGTTYGSDRGLPIVSSDMGVYIKNGPSGDVIIDSIAITNTDEFEYDPNNAMNAPGKFTLTADGQTREILITYKPKTTAGATTDVIFYSSNAGNKIAKVTGCATKPGAEIVKNEFAELSCVVPDQVVPFNFQINSTGSAKTMIKGVVASNDVSMFRAPSDPSNPLKHFDVKDGNGATVQFPKELLPTESWYVSTIFTPSTQTNGNYTMTLQMVDEFDQPLPNGTVTANAKTEYKAYRYNNQVVFPAVPYKSAPITQDLEVENLTDVPVSIENPPAPVFGGGGAGSHPGSFSVVAPTTWPLVLGPREKKMITIQFDPSKSSDPIQDVNLVPKSTACEEVEFKALAEISVGGITAGTYPSQEAFSCATTTVDIDVKGDADIDPAPLTWTITGPDAANFSTAIADGMDISASQIIPVPVVFTPTAGTAPRTYNATITFSYTGAQNKTTTRSVDLAGVSGGIVASATSTFATRNAQAGDVVRLPIAIDIKKNVSSLDLSTANLRTAHLVYTYNTDLLSFGDRNIANSLFNPPAGWTVDGARSREIPGTGLDLWLTGPTSLTENVQSLGEIEFFVRLPEKDQTDDVKLESFELLGANGETFGQCLSTSATGTQLNLVYRCGDAVYREIMENGKLASIEPLRPNPITNQKMVTFRYATRVEAPITLEIVDALGNVVERVVDNLFHQVGAYEVSYDVSKLQSGSYIYRLTSPGTKTSNRFVVTK
jgi:hypothetical protein